MNKKLYVGNLPFNAEESQLKIHFEADGRQVTSVKIMMDRETGRSRGFAFIEMCSPEDAQKAIAALNNQDFMGRPLMINEARELPPRTGGFGGPRPNMSGGGSSGAPSTGPRPNGPGGPPSSSGGFGGGGPSRGYSGGGGFGGGGGGGGFPPSGAGFEPPPADRGGRANRDRGKEREKDRKKRGKGEDW